MSAVLWISLATAIFGGVGLKIVEHLLNRKQVTVDEGTEIRKELRVETKALKEEVTRLRTDVDIWKEKYYKLIEAGLREKEELAEFFMDGIGVTPPEEKEL